MDNQPTIFHAATAFGPLKDFFSSSFLSPFSSSETKPWPFVLLHEDEGYRWHAFIEGHLKFLPTECIGPNIGLACHLARMKWGRLGFRTLRCGTLFTLPERDEIGSPALFHEMIQSLSVSSGIVFDSNRGYSYRVDQISEEAIHLYKSLKNHF